MNEEMKKDFSQLFSGNAQRREYVYDFHETNENMRALLKGEGGIAYYQEIIEIAKEAGAPLEEVRNRFIPLVGKERLQEYADKAVADLMKKGKFGDALEKYVDVKKSELEQKRKFLQDWRL